MKLILPLLTIFMVSCLFASAGNGQTIYIRGKVIDKLTLKPLAGVNVSVENDDLGIGTITNAKGEFRLWNLPYDTSKIKITHNGYQSAVIEVKNLSKTYEQIVVIKLDEESKHSKANTNKRKPLSLKKRTMAKK